MSPLFNKPYESISWQHQTTNFFHLKTAQAESTRFTLGNIPQSLHGDVKNLADEYSMSIAQTIAALLDFVEEHNDAYKEAIAKKASMSRR